MTKEEEKEVLHLVQAWAEGKTLQYSFGDGWKDVNLEHMLCDILKYRIKPESKYRPFHNVEECWDEMQKHKPFGWLKAKTSTQIYSVYEVSETSDWVYRFNTYTFADGTPYGIKEEYL